MKMLSSNRIKFTAKGTAVVRSAFAGSGGRVGGTFYGPPSPKSTKKKRGPGRPRKPKKKFVAGEESYPKLAKFLRMKQEREARKLEKTSGVALVRVPVSGKGGTTALQPSVTKSAKLRRSGSNGVQGINLYKETFEYGNKPSSTVRAMARMNGTTMETLKDTAWSSTAVSHLQGLRTNFGFNQKNVRDFGNASYVHSRNVEFAFPGIAPGSYGSDTESPVKNYGMCLREISTYKISNSNAFFPVNIALNLIGCVDEDLGSADMMSDTFRETDSGIEGEKVPKNYQFGTFTKKPAPNPYTEVLVDKRLKLTSSINFRRKYFVMKRFTKRLLPGDVYELKVTHWNGPGWDLGVHLANADFADDPSDPATSFFPILETWGVQCEAFDILDVGVGRIGSSPGQTHMSHCKAVELINASAGADVNTSNPERGLAYKFAVRQFRKSVEKSPQYNVGYFLIGSPTDTSKVLTIPAMSDASINYSQTIDET